MLVCLGGRDVGSYRGLAHKGLHEKVKGNSCEVYRRDTNKRLLYRLREDVGLK